MFEFEDYVKRDVCYQDFFLQGINYDANKTSTTITSNGKLYSAIITLMLRKQSCRGEMFVVCHIGNQHIVVQKKRLEKCPVTGNKFYKFIDVSKTL